MRFVQFLFFRHALGLISLSAFNDTFLPIGFVSFMQSPPSFVIYIKIISKSDILIPNSFPFHLKELII